MFAAERWGAAFIAVAGEEAEEAYGTFKVLSGITRRIPGVVSGVTAAGRLETLLRRSYAECGAAGRSAEIALRFLVLLARRDGLSRLDAALRAIGEELDRKNGIIAVAVETAQPLDADYQEALRERLKQKTGAAEVKLDITLVPELLEGCRIRIGSERLDASLRGQLEKMAADLESGRNTRDS